MNRKPAGAETVLHPTEPLNQATIPIIIIAIMPTRGANIIKIVRLVITTAR